MLESVDHIELITRSLSESIRFYGLIGFSVTRETDHHGASVEMHLPGYPLVLEMHEADGQEVIGVNHVAYRVADLDAAVEASVRAGARVQKAPFYYEPTGRWLASLRDPDGWRLQLIGPGGAAIQAPAPRADDIVVVLDHLEIHSRLVESYARFYERLGLAPARRGEGRVEFHLPGDPPATLRLHQVADDGVVGINHLRFAVSDLDRTLERLTSSTAVQRDGGEGLLSCRDPDGWRIQFTERPALARSLAAPAAPGHARA